MKVGGFHSLYVTFRLTCRYVCCMPNFLKQERKRKGMWHLWHDAFSFSFKWFIVYCFLLCLFLCWIIVSDHWSFWSSCSCLALNNRLPLHSKAAGEGSQKPALGWSSHLGLQSLLLATYLAKAESPGDWFLNISCSKKEQWL